MFNSLPTIFVRSGQLSRRLPWDGDTLRDALLAGGIALDSSCGGNGSCGRCAVHLEESASFPATETERLLLSGRQLKSGLRLACQIRPNRMQSLHVAVESGLASDRWRPMREDEYCMFELPRAQAFPDEGGGIAIDVGTTHIRLTLWDLGSGKRLAGRTGLNPQRGYGADVLSRLMEASAAPEVARELQHLAVRAIAEAIVEATAEAGVAADAVSRVAIVGNTAMLTLLAGHNFELLMSPENWTRKIEYQPHDTGFLRDAWGLPISAEIRFVPPLGGFIGSDIYAGIVAARLTERPAGSLLIDFGTNTEMVLWDGKALHVTSAAGGPAFEGSGIRCGMPAENGAIYRVRQENAGLGLDVLGGGEPKGICGSGLVDAIAWMRAQGSLDRVGRLSRDLSDGFVLHRGDQDIALTGRDIDVFQRAKAAIGAGVHWLCEHAGMEIADLKQVYACGAFGRLLDVGHARSIGLLPPYGEVELQGNTALAGCEMLLSSALAGNPEGILASVRVHNMAMEERFETLFIENLYLDPMRG